jgi:hypothetical protein
MRSLSRPAKLALIVAVSLASVGGMVHAQSVTNAIGIASAILGDVRYTNTRVTKAAKMALRQRVLLGDLVQTGKGSQLQMLLLDRSTFSIGANARIRIDRFVYDPARGRSIGATVAKGAFRFMSGRPNAGGNGASSISSPVATIGIRGTIVEGVVGKAALQIAADEVPNFKSLSSDAANATLVVLRGPGAHSEGRLTPGFVSVSSSAGSVDLTQPMQASYVPRAGAMPIGPFVISPKGMIKVEQEIFPAKYKGSGAWKGVLAAGALVAVPVLLGRDRTNCPPHSPQGDRKTPTC